MGDPSTSKPQGIGLDLILASHSGAPGSSHSGIESARLVPPGDTLANISTIGTSIEATLNRIPENAPNKQAFAAAVRVSVAGAEKLLSGQAQINPGTKSCAENLFRRLQDLQAHLQDRQVYGKRAQIKGKFRALVRSPTTTSPTYHINIQSAFEALKNSTLLAHGPTTQRSHPEMNLEPSAPVPKNTAEAPSTNSPPPKVEVAASPNLNKEGHDEASKKDSRWTTVVDTVEGGLRILSSTTTFIPEPAGSVVKLMAGAGIKIIDALKGMSDNQDEAMELGSHIGGLIQSAGRFLERTDSGAKQSADAETTNQLQLFLNSLKGLEKDIAEFHAQSRLRQGLSHKTNKDDLTKWSVSIDRAFVALQAQLSLDSIRLLTSLSGADALRERDRLIGLLGDGDNGATEKAADPEDLMCLQGTRKDVLGRVDEWMSDPLGSRAFWISGVAGCGKSAVAATIAGRQRAIPTSTAIFHFARGNQERNKRVVCSLSRQLAQFGHGSLEQFVLSSIKANPDIATSHITNQFRHLIIGPLKKLVPGSAPVILVLDALDEWDNQAAATKLVELIGQAHVELPPNVRFIITSRNEPHLINALDSAPMRPLVTRYALDSVLKADTARDIRLYMETRFAKLNRKLGIAPDGRAWPEEEHVHRLVALSDGLFQWVSTVMSYIEAKRSRGRLREILKNPEQYMGLDNLYQGVLDMAFQGETNERVPRLLQGVLGALLAAAIPIDIITIAYLCSGEVDTQEETMELIQEEILPSLASLFIIPKDPTQPITVSHPSVIDFFTTKTRCPDLRFYIEVNFHHKRLFNACFQIMESTLRQDICGIEDPTKLNEEVQAQVTQHIPSRLRYSCQYWATHLQHFEYSTAVESLERLGNFSRSLLLNWLEVLSLIGSTTRAIRVAQDVGLWLLGCPSLSSADRVTQTLWKDMERFVAMFLEPISTAAAHIYISAFRLAPTETELARQFSKTVKWGLQIKQGPMGRQWPASLWVGRGHKESVRCIAFSADGKTVASGSLDETIRLWEADSGALKAEPLVGHTGWVNCLSFSPDGKTIASGSEDHTIRLWDIDPDSATTRTLVGHTERVQCISFSPNGRMIASGSSDKTVRLWDAESYAFAAKSLVGHTDVVRCLSFSPDGMTIASGSDDKTVRVWDTISATLRAQPLGTAAQAVAYLSFSSDGRTVVSRSADNTVFLWNAETGAIGTNPQASVGNLGRLNCLSFSRDGRAIASGSPDSAVRVWDAESGALRAKPLRGHRNQVYCVSFSPDGNVIASGSKDFTVRLWAAAPGGSDGEDSSDPRGEVQCLSFTPDGKTIVSGWYDTFIRFWDARSGALKPDLLVGHSHAVSCLSISFDGRTIASGSYDHTVRLWDIESYSPKAELVGHTVSLRCLAFSPDSRRLASGSDGPEIRIWDVDSGLPSCNPLVGHTGAVYSLVFSSDGRTIASGSWDRTIRLWDADSGVCVAEPLVGHEYVVCCLSFSPNGKILASGAYDGKVLLWDPTSGILISDLSGIITSAPHYLSFSSDGLALFGTTTDGYGHMWNMASIPSITPSAIAPVLEMRQLPTRTEFRGRVSKEGWIVYLGVRLMWLPIPGAEWVLCGSCLTLGRRDDMYIIDVSEILYLVE